MNSFYNVLVIGAGISGIGAGHYLKKKLSEQELCYY